MRDTVEIDLLSCSELGPDAAHAVAKRAHRNLKTVHLSAIVVDVEHHGFSCLPHRCSRRLEAGHLVAMLLKASVHPTEFADDRCRLFRHGTLEDYGENVPSQALKDVMVTATVLVTGILLPKQCNLHAQR
jgi:hypothetical protein